ncbi:unnamed protein product [Vitrella brassicaformis CCMP3155]|uniref:Protein kinase domain-containing protein n=1 Tax=Vitrella brassicaformis (strain CCMP3155) TaxID=1169540 RepID=A0A0G4GZT4_VITBC|nr:unnamed protein product [Vitrella brassicaformis CCMP3155]|eukprot:CEM36598.1 unnamed protein product [Vitrella brassicaformis CCMP3155]
MIQQLHHTRLNSTHPSAGGTRLVPRVLAEAADVEALRPVVNEDGERVVGTGRCLVMTKVGDGLSLKKFAEGRNAVPPFLKPTAAVNTSRAILALHNAEITHNDPHAENFLMADETTGEVGVIDFETSRDMRQASPPPLDNRIRPPATTVGNMQAVLKERAMRDEEVGYHADLVAVASSLLPLCCDNSVLSAVVWMDARDLVKGVLTKCEDGRLSSMEEVTAAYPEAIKEAYTKAVKTIGQDERLTPATHAISLKTAGLFRDVCIGHAEGLAPEVLRAKMATYCDEVTAGERTLVVTDPDFAMPAATRSVALPLQQQQQQQQLGEGDAVHLRGTMDLRGRCAM